MFIIDYRDKRPIYEQIIDKMAELMMHGALKADDKLPSVRNLAMDLSINPNTIQRAYFELERQGYIYSIKGKGSFVCDLQKIRDDQKFLVLEEFQTLVQKARRFAIPKETLIEKVNEEFAKEVVHDSSK